MDTSFGRAGRALCLVVGALTLAPDASAEWQIKPFVGLTFGGSTTFVVDFEDAVGTSNLAFGVNGTWLGEVLGVEADFGYAPGFFESGDQDLVRDSRVVTLTGNAVVALPRHLAQYSLRPYFVGGFGVMGLRLTDPEGVFTTSRSLAAIDLGGGVTGFLTDRIGLNWDVRWFGSVGGEDRGQGVSTGAEELSFWRATMAVAVRY